MIPTIKEWEKEFNNSTKDLADVINQKAGFKPGQQRDKDGKWIDKWAGMKTREQEIKDQKKETALIYDADGNLLQEIGGSEHHVEIPLLQDGAHILTHNHPNSSSFSRADIAYLLNTDIDKIRAVGPNGNIFEMTITGNILSYAMDNDEPLVWKNYAVNDAWTEAKKLADIEVAKFLTDKYGKDWESPSWRKNQTMIELAQGIFGSYSDRVNHHLANSTKLGSALFTYKKIEP
jgi:hypothetical protein